MKILSKMIVSCRRIKWLGLCIFFLLSLQSCDTGFTLPLDNNKFNHDIHLSENRMVKVSSMYFGGWYYLSFNLKGDYVLNPDSLRLDFCDKNIKVGKSFPFSGINTYKDNNTHVKNKIISVQLRYERQGVGDEDSLALFVLPSDFLMCNEKRVLTDSLRIVLKKAKRK
ncbi:hypothetical protein [Prevotella melaninogenica]|jgi:hypothetical protein|uniref:hypothetical protein n=1 Tax=Prevotella melaninogenica TaxID=28132 RepID=UPI0021509B00|nr:hypothetical protein [Prevotella melaninogenica]